MKKHSFIAYLLLITIITASFVVGYKRALKTNESYKQQIRLETLETNPVPECHYGNCPKFESFDTDGDGKSETIGVVYATMTSFAGQVWVIDDGEVKFISDEKMMIGVKPTKEYDQDNGFIIYYSTKQDPKSNNDVEWAYYKYAGGEYSLDKITKPNQ
jgi:hypothetical protein